MERLQLFRLGPKNEIYPKFLALGRRPDRQRVIRRLQVRLPAWPRRRPYQVPTFVR